jgi:protein-disulfide isomerase
VLGTEPEILATYVETGDVRLVYWPMLDHGNAGLNAHAASECIGRQDVDAFWEVHDRFYANQGELWGADKAYYSSVAADVGVDPAAFEACYDSGEAHAVITELDDIRRELGIFNRPTFDINGQLLVGAQPFSSFMGVIDALLSS